MLISTLNDDCLQTLKVFNVTNESTSCLVSLKQIELMAILFTGHSDWGFTGGSDGKNLPAMQHTWIQDPRSTPGSRISPEEGNGSTLQYSWIFAGGSDGKESVCYALLILFLKNRLDWCQYYSQGITQSYFFPIFCFSVDSTWSRKISLTKLSFSETAVGRNFKAISAN